MPLHMETIRRPAFRLVAILLGALALGIALRGPLLRVIVLALGAGVLCFVAAPLSQRFETRLSRPVAVLLALLAVAGAILLVAWLLLPTLLRDLMELAQTLPESLLRLSGWLDQARAWVERRLPAISLPRMNFEGMQGLLAGIAGGTIGLVVNLADVVGRLSMMVMLAYFFLCDRDRLLLMLELLLPQSVRHTAVCMGNAVLRELRLYLRGQLMIAGAVSALSAALLMIVGVRSALALGIIIGLLNMIPYFGPFIGGVPAVLIALGDGWQRALLTVAALTLVQQLDGSWISPRIMGNLTGFSPAAVLIGIYAGASLGGVAGMLFALPVMMTGRTLFRIFVQKCENI